MKIDLQICSKRRSFRVDSGHPPGGGRSVGRSASRWGNSREEGVGGGREEGRGWGAEEGREKTKRRWRILDEYWPRVEDQLPKGEKRVKL